MPALDTYDPEAIDDVVGDDVTFEEAAAARLRAEREMDRRDVREGRGTLGRRHRLPGALEGVAFLFLEVFCMKWPSST